jgi:hypothetical protein
MKLVPSELLTHSIAIECPCGLQWSGYSTISCINCGTFPEGLRRKRDFVNDMEEL